MIVACCSMAKAQERYMPHYTTADGLPSNTVYKVVKDERGFLWLATSNGICRFDGHRFETFSLKGLVNDVEFIDIFIGKQGRIWFIPFSGDILLYDGTKFQNGKAFFGRTLEDFQSYEATAYLMASPKNAARLNQAVAEIEANTTINHELLDQ